MSRLLALLVAAAMAASSPADAQDTRLLRQPTVSADHVAFTYGSDIWVVDRAGGLARRLTSTAAVEAEPRFSPDGRHIAFSSNRSGSSAIYVVPVEGGTPRRLTWYPAGTRAVGWTPSGSRIMYASTRETAPSGYNRLWTVSPDGGPSELLPAPWGFDGSYSPDGSRLIIDRMSRWETEFQDYRGGQNTPLILMDLDTLDETWLPNERTTDTQPVWLGDTIYFLSDRNGPVNVFTYDPISGDVSQLTEFGEPDVKWLSGEMSGSDGSLVIERDGYLHELDPATGEVKRIHITVRGDFPWAEPVWEFVGDDVSSAALSPTGARAVFEARGEIFTVPADEGAPRNLSRTSGAADRAPTWSPDGSRVAWFSDDGNGYVLMLADQDGSSDAERIDIGESAMAWDPVWSPDGMYLAFVDDDLRIQVMDMESREITTADTGGINIRRGNMGVSWSPDSKWLTYAKTGANNFRRVFVWHVDDRRPTAITDPMADSFAPSFDRDGRHLYILASTDVSLASGWANTSSMKARPTQDAYVVILRADDPTPFPPESDEEVPAEEEEETDETDDTDETGENAEEEEDEAVRIDFENLNRRTLALPMPSSNYSSTVAGPEGSVFIAGSSGLQKFTLEEREAESFMSGVFQYSVSNDGKKLLARAGRTWRIVDTARPPNGDDGALDMELRMNLDRTAEWTQIFEEAWHYAGDFFYDPDMHGRNWQTVRRRYEPLVEHVRHRHDLNYILDQMNGEMSVGHSFVFGGDYPGVDTSWVGLLGADLQADDGRWRISRIYTSESWNPGLTAPLDRPGIDVSEGDFIVAIDRRELTADDDPYRLLDGTAGRQTSLLVNDTASMEGAREVLVEPIRSESGLRQRAWVEDNRRYVEEHSDGRLAYIWVPNTGGGGVVSFDRYFFAQQDKHAAIIDERFNGGGLLDDYMVNLLTRELRAAITNEVPNARHMRLPAGILGPKVLLINERAGSGGDYFPWVFRHQNAGPLIGMRTWGGLVKSSVHYPFVDGGAMTAPDNAVFDPIENEWIAENEGVAPDIEVRLSAKALAEGRDPQLDRAIEEALQLLEENPPVDVQ
ncbi:MAG: protease, partial [Rhodothermales bacterium]|nr:protease [Rhodothermales bacterium]